MLSASLQSTWEAQRMKQRGKHGYEEMDAKMASNDNNNPYINKSNMNGLSMTSQYRPSNDGLGVAELPNLKIPQVS
jgi:hypothetical protein